MKETDVYYPKDQNRIQTVNGEYKVKDYAALIDVQEAEVIARYQENFYRGEAAVTCHNYGKGQAFFIAPRTEQDYLTEFYSKRSQELNLSNPLIKKGNPLVSVQSRSQGNRQYHFVMNFSEETQVVTLSKELMDELTKEKQGQTISLAPYQVRVLVEE